MQVRLSALFLPALAALLSGLIGCSSMPQKRENFVSLTELDPTIMLDMRYAGPDNFVGTPIDGYQAPVCLLTRPAATRLVRINRILRSRGLALIVYDCYRPQRAVNHFMRWARDRSDRKMKAFYYPDVPKSELFERGYIAARSSHSRGSTVDVGLVRSYQNSGFTEWQPVDMGTTFDLFDRRSHTDSPFVTTVQRLNRLRLLEVMEKNGFRNFPQEWWHFTLKKEPYPDTYFDFVVESIEE